jgi:hypothetical protein
MKYSTNENIVKHDNEITCLICWEEKNKHDIIEKLKTILPYHHKCKCNGYFHKSCITKWVEMYMSCPICRVKLSPLSTTSIILITHKSQEPLYFRFMECIIQILYILWIGLFMYHVITYIY